MAHKVLAYVPAGCLAMTAVLAGVAAASSATTITASPIPANGPPFLRLGTIVSSSGLGNRVFVNQSHGFSLWTSRDGTTYPGCTGNGGRVWVICGPHLHVEAANAPNVVTQVGAQRAEYFAYGGPNGAESIVVSTSQSKWYRAYMPGVPYGVSASENGELFAFVVAGKSTTEWTSSNGGRTWKRS